MPKAHIQLAYRQIIDAGASTAFEQQIFHATWSEFLLQQQSFSKGQPLYTWEAIRESFPKSDPTLPFKVSFSIAGILHTLNGQIPGLQDTLGLCKIPFVQHRFELIASDTKDRSAHKVGLIYLTDTLTLYETLGDRLLLAIDPPSTFLLQLQPGLSICHYKPIFTGMPAILPDKQDNLTLIANSL